MKFLSDKFDTSILLLILAFGFGLAVSSSGCVESGVDSVSRKRPTTIGVDDQRTGRTTLEQAKDLSSNS